MNTLLNIVKFTPSEFIVVEKSDRRRSKLLPFRNEILFLKEQGFSEKVILDFICYVAKLDISQQALNTFIKNCVACGDALTNKERVKIMSDLEDFLNTHQPSGKASRLTPFRDEIFQLKALGYSAQDILLFLKKYKDIDVSAGTLNTYIRREKEKTKAKLERMDKTKNTLSGSLNDEPKKKKGRPSQKDNPALQETPAPSSKFKLMNKDELDEYMRNLK